MPYIVVIGLLVLLVLLLVVRSAQQDAVPIEAPRPTGPTAPSTPPSNTVPPVRAAVAPARGQNDRGGFALEHDRYLWESRRIAHRHEARAETLDFFGVLVSVLAGLIAFGTVGVLLSEGGNLDRDVKVMIGLVSAASVLVSIAVAALLFGFGAVVRNTSRSLAIGAGVALDSYDPPDDGSSDHSTALAVPVPSAAQRPGAHQQLPGRRISPSSPSSPWMPPQE